MKCTKRVNTFRMPYPALVHRMYIFAVLCIFSYREGCCSTEVADCTWTVAAKTSVDLNGVCFGYTLWISYLEWWGLRFSRRLRCRLWGSGLWPRVTLKVETVGFPICLFNDAVSSTDCIARGDQWKWFVKDVEGSGRGLLQCFATCGPPRSLRCAENFYKKVHNGRL
jgi:hypothetical protein